MNKYNIISIIVLIVTTLITLSFDMLEGFDYHLISYILFLGITFIMLYRRKNIKKFKFIYNVISYIMAIVSILFMIIMIGFIITYIVSPSYQLDGGGIAFFFLLTLLFILTSIHIIDVKVEKNKFNHILTWISSTIIFLIYLRYHYDNDLLHNYMYSYATQNSYVYITQNYIYLVFIYLSLLIHYFINKNYHNR